MAAGGGAWEGHPTTAKGKRMDLALRRLMLDYVGPWPRVAGAEGGKSSTVLSHFSSLTVEAKQKFLVLVLSRAEWPPHPQFQAPEPGALTVVPGR